MVQPKQSKASNQQSKLMAGQYGGRWGQVCALLLLALLTAGAQGRPGISQDIGHPRFLATIAQKADGAAGEGMQPVGVDAQPQCSATIVYGASVGDISKRLTADVVPFVGSFDVVVTQPHVSAAVAGQLSKQIVWLDS